MKKFNNKKYTVMLFSTPQMSAYDDSKSIVSNYFNVIDMSKKEQSEYEKYINKTDLVISIFNTMRIKGDILKKTNFNIHAAPSWYRGVGAIGKALYDEKKDHGVVVHEMNEEIDLGCIFIEDIFSIVGLDAYDIASECIKKSLSHLEYFCDYFNTYATLPKKDKTLNWSGDLLYQKDFYDWLKKVEFKGKKEVLEIYGQFH